MTKRLLVPIAALMLSAFALTACGGSDDNGDTTAADTAATTATTSGSSSGGSSTIAISADPSGALAYEQTDVTAKAGADTLDFTNDSSTPHDVVVEGDDGEVGRTDVIQGDEATADLDLKPGTYTFFCSVPGHREAGMEGTLTVK
jgi:plastocyanin